MTRRIVVAAPDHQRVAFTVREAAERLGVSVETVYRRLADGTLTEWPSRGGCRRVTARSLLALPDSVDDELVDSA